MKLLALLNVIETIKEQQGVDFMSRYDVIVKPFQDGCPVYEINDKYRFVTIYVN